MMGAMTVKIIANLMLLLRNVTEIDMILMHMIKLLTVHTFYQYLPLIKTKQLTKTSARKRAHLRHRQRAWNLLIESPDTGIDLEYPLTIKLQKWVTYSYYWFH